jgi:hypothetical protein
VGKRVKKNSVGKTRKAGKRLDCSLTGAALVQLKSRRGLTVKSNKQPFATKESKICGGEPRSDYRLFRLREQGNS